MEGLQIFQLNDYDYYGYGGLCSYVVAPKEKDGHLPVVVLIDNRAGTFRSRYDFPRIEKGIRDCCHTPGPKEESGVEMDFLWVITAYGYDRAFRGPNTIILHHSEEIHEVITYMGRMNPHLKDAVQIVKDTMKYNRARHIINYGDRLWSPSESYKPWMVYILLAVNVLVYFLVGDSYWKYGYTPEKVMSGSILELYTYMFVHAGAVHLIGNMAALLFYGYALEKRVGSIAFLLTYLVSGVGAAYCDSIIKYQLGQPLDVVTVGASGAICGLLTCLLTESIIMTILRINNFSDKHFFFRMWLWMARLTAITIVAGMASMYTNISVHRYGLFIGFLTGIVCVSFSKHKKYDELAKASDIVRGVERRLHRQCNEPPLKEYFGRRRSY